MIRRWIIRGFFLFLLLLCMVGWVWSVSDSSYIGYCRNGRLIVCISSRSVIGVRWEDHNRMLNGWYFGVIRQTGAYAASPVDPQFNGRYMFFGFGFARYGMTDDLAKLPWNVCDLMVPYWFLLAIFSAVLLFIWRKTRTKLSAATAFPVETPGGPP